MRMRRMSQPGEEAREDMPQANTSVKALTQEWDQHTRSSQAEAGDVNKLWALEAKVVGTFFKCEEKPCESLERRAMQTILHF